jgi:hypothetical protein
MAIALQPKFSSPDRSKQTVRFTKDEDGVIDIGWCDGVLSDGRAYRAEMWAEDQVSMLTIFFSTGGMEELEAEQIRRLIQVEELVSFVENGQQHCSALKSTDDAGNEVWSVNVAVGDDEMTFLTKSIPIFPYSKIGEPNTMFHPIPIKAAHAAK